MGVLMYGTVKLACNYLSYYLSASNGKGHGIHSPFVYELVREVFIDQRPRVAYQSPEQYRKEILRDQTEIQVEDLGAGSRRLRHPNRKISAIARSSVKPVKYGRLLHRLAVHFRCRNILELGTSLGVTSAYLAGSGTNVCVNTIEGSPTIAERARLYFERSGLHNINVIQGNFDDQLGDVLTEMGSIDLVYIDGNHRKEPTLRYFEQLLTAAHEKTCLVFDDIHWSKEMEEAWSLIKNDDRVTLTIDLFFVGLVFISPDFYEKQHFSIRF